MRPPQRSSQDLRSLAPPASQENGYLLLVAREVEELKPRVANCERDLAEVKAQNKSITASHEALAEEQGGMLVRIVKMQHEQEAQRGELAQVRQAAEASRSAAVDASIQASASRQTQTTRKTSWGQTLLLALLYLLGMAIKEWIK